MIKLICFDLDGTLISSQDIHFYALNQAMWEVEKFEIPHSVHLMHFNGMTTSTKLNKLVEEGVIQKKNINKIKALKQEYTIKSIKDTLKPDPEKRDMLFRLKQDGYNIAIGTNCIRETAELMLQKADLFDLIEIMITNEDVKNPKPDPEVWIKCMEFFKIPPINTLVIDDHNLGIEAAEKSGANYIKINSIEELNYEFIFKNKWML